MQFTTSIPIPKSKQPIDYASKLVSLGSCFAVNMAAQFEYYKFQNVVNPVGILFHPLAILDFIKRAIHNNDFTKADLFFQNEQWHCFEVHSEMSHPDSSVLLQSLNSQVENMRLQLQQASHLIITYGTAWVYRHRESQKIVANCHKIPQAQFEKELLSISLLEESMQETIKAVQEVNPSVSIIFTISPVRHLKDGFVENQRSKAHLIAALHQVLSLQSALLYYFPSYEIQLDELRDYRFYAEDLLHPNTMAISYIWERFTETWIAAEALPTMADVAAIQKGLLHRSFHPESQSHQKFLTDLQQKVAALQAQFPFIQF